MSLFSVIGLIVLAVTAAAGAIVKVILRQRRNKLDGVHGYVQKEEEDKNDTDDWELL